MYSKYIMKLIFGLLWGRSQKNVKRAFRVPGAGEMFEFYLARIQRHFPNASCEILPDDKVLVKSQGDQIWLCERAQRGAKNPSPEELAAKIENLKVSGASRLWILIGPPNGLSEADLEALKPDFLWSFGKGTYPHELAALIMLEQSYRALTILDNHPYHLGH